MKKKTTNPSVTELRSQAETKLSGRRRKVVTAPTTKADIQRLVHELQVHQVELEMQNEELVQSRAELESTLNMYAELYAFAPLGYFTLTRAGTIHRVNLTGAKLLDSGLSDLIKRNFQMFISPQSLPTFNVFLDKVFISKNKVSCEVTLQKGEADPFWVHIEAICESSVEQKELCYAIVSDITERKKAEEELMHLSTHDVLTGLYNRGFFLEEMARLERGRKFPVSIVMADVDHLTETNDREGNAAGDKLLKRVAQTLTAAFRAEDMIARIGGDEFAVLLPSTDATTANLLLQRVQQVIQENNTDPTETPIRISLGVSTTESSAPLATALKNADLNRYRDKRGDNDTQKNYN